MLGPAGALAFPEPSSSFHIHLHRTCSLRIEKPACPAPSHPDHFWLLFLEGHRIFLVLQLCSATCSWRAKATSRWCQKSHRISPKPGQKPARPEARQAAPSTPPPRPIPRRQQRRPCCHRFAAGGRRLSWGRSVPAACQGGSETLPPPGPPPSTTGAPPPLGPAHAAWLGHSRNMVMNCLGLRFQ